MSDERWEFVCVSLNFTLLSFAYFNLVISFFPAASFTSSSDMMMNLKEELPLIRQASFLHCWISHIKLLLLIIAIFVCRRLPNKSVFLTQSPKAFANKTRRKPSKKWSLR